MNTEEICNKVNGEILVNVPVDVTAFYAGDFLSRVMGKAPTGSAWITVMNNVNVAGVAVLAEIRIIVVCEGSKPAPLLIQKCIEEKIALISTELGMYECCRLLA